MKFTTYHFCPDKKGIASEPCGANANSTNLTNLMLGILIDWGQYRLRLMNDLQIQEI